MLVTQKAQGENIEKTFPPVANRSTHPVSLRRDFRRTQYVQIKPKESYNPGVARGSGGAGRFERVRAERYGLIFQECHYELADIKFVPVGLAVVTVETPFAPSVYSFSWL